MGDNIDANSKRDVSDGTYIGFTVLMFFGAALALLLCNANDVVRKDGSYVILMKNPTWQSEFWGLYETIRFEPFVVFLFPMFFSSNWFYVYQQNIVNGAYFSTRTRALNSLLYWLAQIVAAAIWGYLLDLDHIRRSVRAKIALVVLFVLTFVVWGGGYVHQKTYTREMTDAEGFHSKDWKDSGYIGPMFLYLFYGFYDAAWQATVYWFVSCPHIAAFLTIKGSWAPYQTQVVAPLTTSAFTKAYNPPGPLFRTTWTPEKCLFMHNS